MDATPRDGAWTRALAFTLVALFAGIVLLMSALVVYSPKSDERPSADDASADDIRNPLDERMQLVYDAEDRVLRDLWDKVIRAKNVLSPREREIVLHEAEAHTQRNGWSEGRHRYHPTLDVSVDALRFSKPIVYARVYEKILPQIRKHFDFLPSWGVVYELFVIKMVPDMQDMQERVEKFRDDGLFAFVVPLNAASAYDGGELVIDRSVVDPTDPGTAIVYCGQRNHYTRPVTRGTRYALCGLVHKLERSDRLPLQIA